MSETLVGIVMGSASDLPVMDEASKVLNQLGVPHEVTVLSAHRTPERTRHYASTAGQRGIKVIIAGAGGAAHLAGVIAAETILPVIGVPIDSSPLRGMDALLATVQMPGGIPVATMAIGKAGARNAGLLAAQILAIHDSALRKALLDHREHMVRQVEDAAHQLGQTKAP